MLIGERCVCVFEARILLAEGEGWLKNDLIVSDRNNRDAIDKEMKQTHGSTQLCYVVAAHQTNAQEMSVGCIFSSIPDR